MELRIKENLIKHLTKLLKENLTNKDLSREINIEVLKKPVSKNLGYLLFNKQKDIIDLTEEELILVATVFYNNFKIEEINPKRYFSDRRLIQYYNSQREEKVTPDSIELENVIRINYTSYVAFLGAEKLYNYFVENLFIYDKEAQRQPKIHVLGNNYLVKSIALNKKTVKDISTELIEGTYESDTIILNVLQLENKILNIDYDSKNNTLSIKPNLDLNSPNTTIVQIIDGYHRTMAMVRAVEKLRREKKSIPEDMGLIVKVVVRDMQQAKKIVAQTFKRSNTNKDYLKTLETNDYTKLADAFINNTKLLKNGTENTYEECMYTKGYTYKSLIISTIKVIIDKDKGYLINLAKINKMSDMFNNMLDYIVNEYYSDLDGCRNDSTLLNVNSFVYWLVYLYELVESGTKEEDWLLVADKIVITSKDWNVYNLNSRKVNLKEIIEFAKRLVIEEVLENE